MNIKVWLESIAEMKKYLEGLDGESTIRDYFSKNGIPHMQVDLIYRENGIYKLAEIKHQEPFMPPPFKGHGLPVWQIEARLKLYNETNIEPWLFVVDKTDTGIYYQSFLELLKSKYFDTQGAKPRRVFPLSAFMILRRGLANG